VATLRTADETEATKRARIVSAPTLQACPNGHPLPCGVDRCLRCEDAAAARREIELAEAHPREWNELVAAEDALMHVPRRSPRRKHVEERADRARARWREIEERP
jgi:hypothetical protein